MKLKFLFVTLMAVFALAGCDKSDNASSSSAASTPAASTPAAEVTPAATTVAECKDYISKMETCLSQPALASMKDAVMQGLNQSMSAVAGMDNAAQAEYCKELMAASKEAYTPMGCTF